MFLYWHRTSWLDVRSNLGCLPPSSPSPGDFQVLLLNLPCPAWPSPPSPSSRSPPSATSPPSLFLSESPPAASSARRPCPNPSRFSKSRSWKQQKLWSQWMWEPFKYTQLDPSSPLIAVETVETWEIPVLKLSLSCSSGSHVISWRDVLISLETLQQSKCNIEWWFWCILKKNMHFKPIFNNSPVRYDVKWNVD